MTRVTKRILQNKHTNLDTFKLEDTELSIQLSLDGLSFCIYDGISEEHLLLEHHEIADAGKSPEIHLGRVKEIMENHMYLNRAFRTVKVVHSNNLISQVPKPLFDKNRLQDYLKYTVKLLDNDFISYDLVENNEIVNVYIPFVNINNYLIEKYGSFIYKHSATVLIEKLLIHSKNVEGSHLYVNVNDTDFETVVIRNKQLILYNRFDFKTKEDFIYYILFIAEQLSLNPEEMNLILLGAIEKRSELYDIAYQYVRTIQFLEPLNYSSMLKDRPAHSYFALLNL